MKNKQRKHPVPNINDMMKDLSIQSDSENNKIFTKSVKDKK